MGHHKIRIALNEPVRELTYSLMPFVAIVLGGATFKIAHVNIKSHGPDQHLNE